MNYQINDVRLHVEDHGHGKPALLFLHFWGGSTRTWTEVTDILSPEFRCVRYDYRGWGQSEKPKTGYSIKELASDTLMLIKELQLDDYVIVGHSMGGKIAQYIASLSPAGLRGLILIAPSPAFATFMPEGMHQNMLVAYTSKPGIEHTIDHVFNASGLSAEVRARTIEDMQRHNEAARVGWPEIAMKEDVAAGLQNINVPTTVIVGDKDIVDTPERMKKEVMAHIANAEIKIIPQVGHLSMLQAPREVAAIISSFVANKL
jgi:pimeloyl-ACP methyl ester carboxylesterase